MAEIIHPLGHSNHPTDGFLELLTRHGIQEVIDVRSTPYSRFAPQFNMKRLAPALAQADIQYIFLGHQLGGRPNNPAHYDHSGKAQYQLMATTPQFRAGIDHVINATTRRRTTILCSERDPLSCHRTLLVSRELALQGFDIRHILPTGEWEDHRKSIDQLAQLLGLTGKNHLDRAIDLQSARVAYVRRQ